jgi:hypothetical protein
LEIAASKFQSGAIIAPKDGNLAPERFAFVENNSNFDSYLEGNNRL